MKSGEVCTRPDRKQNNRQEIIDGKKKELGQGITLRNTALYMVKKNETVTFHPVVTERQKMKSMRVPQKEE